MSEPPDSETEIEQLVAQMLADSEAGDIDNVFDIAEELVDYNKRLPATSALRPKWDAFFADCEQIMIDSST